MSDSQARPCVLVMASTYPRWRDDHEPGFVHELCRRLTPGFRVLVLAPDAPGADPSGPFDGVEVRRYRYAPRSLQRLVSGGGIVANLKRSPWKWLLVPGFILGQWWAAMRLLRQEPVAVVHAHWLVPQGVVASLLAWTHRVPFVVTSHGGDLFGLRGGLLTAVKRRVASRAAAMTVVSSAMAAECERLGVRPGHLEVIPMGVDLDTRFSVSTQAARDPDRLLFVGRLVAKKGVCHLLDAMPEVVARRPGVTLDIVGYGPEEDALRAQAKALGLDPHVRFLGAMPQEALPALYRGAALFVAPFVRDASGDQEGLPVALMEALGCGCPVLAGAVPGVEELLGATAAAATVDPRDRAALAERILRILQAPEEAREAARQALSVARQRVDWPGVAARYSRLLGRVAGRGDRRTSPDGA